MSKQINAIPTEYKGIEFRSKLEARVAYFFDLCGISWEYEVDRLGDGDDEYNPDFYLPETDDYVEVKGQRPGFEKEILKARKFVSLEGPIRRLIIISEIPDPTQLGMPHFPCYYASARLFYNEIETGWYFFQDIGEGEDREVRGHISSADYYLPRISERHLDNPQAPFCISPLSDELLTKRKFVPNDYYTEEMYRSDHLQFEKWMKESNKKLFTAFAKARKADFTMRRVK